MQSTRQGQVGSQMADIGRYRIVECISGTCGAHMTDALQLILRIFYPVFRSTTYYLVLLYVYRH